MINKDSQFLDKNIHKSPIIVEDSDEEQNPVELNTYIRNQRKSLAKYDQASHSSDVSDNDEKPPNRDDDE